ncbi:MAG TPA: hypothetical protein VN132_11900, partial [Bdellovibrio sp.]|nr:hypothetical protein [Bdellovibrio sp.]
MNTHLLNRLLLVLLVSQGLIGCKTSTDSGTSTDTPKSSDSNSGQSVSTQPTPTPTPTPSTGGETTGGGSTTPVVPPSTPAQVCDGAVAGTLDAGTISINSGAALTNNFQVTLALNKAFAKDMKISNSADCSCGSWETYATSKTWTLANPNAMDTISVQFRDYEGSVSLCATASIVHDNAAPQISVTADPKNSNLTGTNNVFNYQATDAGAGVKSVTCSIDGQAVACSGSSGQITASNLGAGSHTVSVAAVDNLNQSTEAHVSFVITSPYRNITQNKSITAENKVDILIVVDNSPS